MYSASVANTYVAVRVKQCTGKLVQVVVVGAVLVIQGVLCSDPPFGIERTSGVRPDTWAADGPLLRPTVRRSVPAALPSTGAAAAFALASFPVSSMPSSRRNTELGVSSRGRA